MSSDTEPRPQAGPPRASEDAPTTAIPRPTGPWTPSPVVLGPPRGPHGPQPMWQGRPPLWSVPPAGLGTAAPMPTPPARSGMRAGWVVIAIVAAIAAVALIGTVAANRTMTVTGSVTIYGMYGAVSPGSSCSNTAVTGMPVTIHDAAGDLVGTATLTGYGTARNTWSSYSYGYADSCQYAFTMSDVAASDHYLVKSGRSNGDGVGFTREEIESNGAHITLR
ncbi:hypothetical protein [Actinomycetospora lemnae]|uniref:Uncharacterized protein n=1 Tax=Actinomycetospora lemnae TaxID=3019891 RepID=A0ABT5SVK1_9PSEU|nr:hypothetical protein [Actinomycetospora sp. DW7H6]MDD7966799.1 hypothetical protein [Actinomycetospora sp. DW7H6]